MWGKPPFVISDNCALDVRNLKAAREWYKEKLGLRDSRDRREDDFGRPFADLMFASEDALLSLVELAPGASPEKAHVILFAKNLEKAHKWLADRGVPVAPLATASAGNPLFEFLDLDGNAIEVCVEP